MQTWQGIGRDPLYRTSFNDTATGGSISEFFGQFAVFATGLDGLKNLLTKLHRKEQLRDMRFG